VERGEEGDEEEEEAVDLGDEGGELAEEAIDLGDEGGEAKLTSAKYASSKALSASNTAIARISGQHPSLIISHVLPLELAQNPVQFFFWHLGVGEPHPRQ
jgi:hypothetical protein